MTTEQILLAGITALATSVAHLYWERGKDSKEAEKKAEARHEVTNAKWEARLNAMDLIATEPRRMIHECETEREKLNIRVAVLSTGCLKPDCPLRKGT